MSENQEVIGEVIANLLTQTSVASVVSTDQQQSASPQSKYLNQQQSRPPSNFSKREMIDRLKNNGSIIYGARNPGKSFSWYMRFNSPNGIFSDKNFKARWTINFCRLKFLDDER